MNSSDCYNFDWLRSWLCRNLIEDRDCKVKTSAESIARNFSNCFFSVTDEDVTIALLSSEFKGKIKNGKYYFGISHECPAYDEFKKHWQ